MKMRRLSGYGVPRELEEQILLRLPVKSLLRFRSVCRAWKSLISDRKFVNKHLELEASKTPFSLLLVWVRRDPLDSVDKYHVDVNIPKKQQLSLLSIGDSITSTFVNKQVYLPIRPKLLANSEGGYVASLKSCQCNGIICLVDRSLVFVDRIVFYNPALREHEYAETLPPSSEPCLSYGFGHDPKTDDYKFVRILQSRAEVYSLRTGRWKELNFVIRGSISYVGAYLKGRLYWQQYASGSGRRNVLVWFDVSDESFGTAEMPQLEWTNVMPLLVWKGSLVFFNNVWGSFEMFVMDGKAGGWSRFCRTGKLAVIKPISFWKEDELLMVGEDGSLMSYSLATKTLMKVPVTILAQYGSASGGLYTETLVPVKTRALAGT